MSSKKPLQTQREENKLPSDLSVIEFYKKLMYPDLFITI